MNVDFYAEYMVAKKPSGADTAKKVLLGVATAAVAAFVFLMFFIPVNILMAGFVFYFGYYFMSNLDTEYEYIITNGEMDVDKIMGKRKRKRLVTAPIDRFTAFGPLKEAGDSGSRTVVLATDGTDENAYYADFTHKSAGEVRIIFTPSDKIIDGIVMFLPRQLKAEFNRTRRSNRTDEE